MMATLFEISVFPVAPPPYNPATHELVEDNPVIGGDGVCRQAWIIKPKPVDTGAPYRAFWAGLLTSEAYQVIRTQAELSQGLLLVATEFIANMGDAKLGAPNIAVLQQCLTNITIKATNLTPTHWTELKGLLTNSGLADTYQLPTTGDQ